MGGWGGVAEKLDRGGEGMEEGGTGGSSVGSSW